jgi:hypothetical protein
VDLAGTIDSDTAARGDVFAGTVAKAVVSAGKVLIPEGAPVAGRIEKVEIRFHPPKVAIDLSLASVRIGGVDYELFVAGKPKVKLSEALKALSTLGPIKISSTPDLSPPSRVDSLLFSGEHAVLERGYRTEWIPVRP